MTTTINAALSGGLINSADTSGILQLQTASTAAVTIDASQNVGIGTSSPSTKLQVSTATGGSTTGLSVVASGNMLNVFGSSSTNAGVILDATNGTVGSATGVPTIFRYGGTESMRIDSSGNLLVGTTTQLSGSKFTMATATANPLLVCQYSGTTANDYSLGGVMGYDNSNLNGDMIIRRETSTTTGYIAFRTNGGSGITERLGIDGQGWMYQPSAGSARIFQGIARGGSFTTGADNQIFTCPAVSGIAMSYSGTSNVPFLRFWNGSGQTGGIYVSGSNTAYNTSSDYRLKENIIPMAGALARISQLKPCTFKWKFDGSDGEGFIAHELAEVVPHAVTGEKDALDEEGNIKSQGIDTSFLVATLTAAIQEQQALITDLTTRLAALEGAK